MKRPVEVELPGSASAGQIIGCVVTLLRALGWDLGQHYDAFMRPKFGSGWLEDLRRKRQSAGGTKYRQRLNLHDPSFGLTEPLVHSDSPLRECLPRGKDFYDLLTSVSRIRNAEQHFDRHPTLSGLDDRAKVIGDFAGSAELPLAQDCRAVRERVRELTKQGPGKVASSLELATDLERERARTVTLAGDISQLRSELGNFQRVGATAEDQRRELEDRLVAVEQARAAVEDQLVAAHTALAAQLAEERAQKDVPPDLQVGDEWRFSPGSRILKLLPHVGDLFDSELVRLYSDEVGPVSVAAAARWLKYLPHGGNVHLTDGGRACALLCARWIYLGMLDEEGSGEMPDSMQGDLVSKG